MRILIALISFFVVAASGPATAAVPQDTVQTTWRLLDYLAVDYRGAVQGGRVVSASEFAEMQEFAGTAERQMRSLPATPGLPSLVAQAGELRAVIHAKAPAPDVAARARRLGAELLRAYPV